MISLRNFVAEIKFVHPFYRAYSTSPSQIQEKTIKIDKWNINYIKAGRGPHHVFFLPGVLGTIWKDFKPQIEGFDKEKFTLVVWDPPGYGKSRPPDKDFTGDFYKRDADYAFLFMKALEIRKYSIVGWSNGGVCALIHAAKYPDCVTKLVAVSARSTVSSEGMTSFTQLRDINTWSRNMREEMTEIYGESLPEYWNRWIDGLQALARVDNGHVCANLLKDIECPTYILYGGKDNMSPPSNAIDIAKNISGARSHMYPHGHHDIHIKYAEDFNKRVQDFLLEP